jgi:hypothetical protein
MFILGLASAAPGFTRRPESAGPMVSGLPIRNNAPAGLTRPRRRWMADVLIVEDLPMPKNPGDRSADGTSP